MNRVGGSDSSIIFWLSFIYRLLDVLADRKAKKGLSGHVLVNGKRQSRNFKCASAYVVQVSRVFGLLWLAHVSVKMHVHMYIAYT